MVVKKTLNGDTLTIAVDGWLDTLTAPEFHNEVQNLQDAKNIVLDYGSVEYISSAGLRETVALFRRVSERGGAFSVKKVKKDVMDVFTMTGFDKLIEISAD